MVKKRKSQKSFFFSSFPPLKKMLPSLFKAVHSGHCTMHTSRPVAGTGHFHPQSSAPHRSRSEPYKNEGTGWKIEIFLMYLTARQRIGLITHPDFVKVQLYGDGLQFCPLNPNGGPEVQN